MRQMLLKATWGTSLVIAMAIMTQGLWATVYFERTVEAVAAERRGHAAILVASVMLVVLSLFAHRVLAAPPLVPLAILAAVAVCVGVARTDAIALLSLLAAYPLALGALVGGLLLDRRAAP